MKIAHSCHSDGNEMSRSLSHSLIHSFKIAQDAENKLHKIAINHFYNEFLSPTTTTTIAEIDFSYSSLHVDLSDGE